MMKSMDYHQFLASLYDIADLFFNEDFDIKYPPEDPNYPVVSFRSEEKFEILLDWLQCDQKSVCRNKMKQYGEPFCSGKFVPVTRSIPPKLPLNN